MWAAGLGCRSPSRPSERSWRPRLDGLLVDQGMTRRRLGQRGHRPRKERVPDRASTNPTPRHPALPPPMPASATHQSPGRPHRTRVGRQHHPPKMQVEACPRRPLDLETRLDGLLVGARTTRRRPGQGDGGARDRTCPRACHQLADAETPMIPGSHADSGDSRPTEMSPQNTGETAAPPERFVSQGANQSCSRTDER